MKKYLEYKDDKSQKFWRIEVSKNEFTVTYGKIETKGQSKIKSFENPEIAMSEAIKLVNQKLKKGYKEKTFEELILEKEKEWTPQHEEMLDIMAEGSTKSREELKLHFIKHTIERTLNISEQTTTKTDTNGNNQEIDYFAELVKFDKKYRSESYAQSFWIVDDEDDFFDTWVDIDDEAKLKAYSTSMKIFASADGTGARYAFWLTNGNTDVNKAPVICYGSEGEIVIVAENIKDLIKMLSFGAEGMDGSFGHYIDNDDEDDDYNFYEEFLEYTPNHKTFRKWMKDTLNIEPVNIDKLIAGQADESKEINKMQKKARKKLKKAFNAWQYQFYPDPKEEEKAYYLQQEEKYKTNKEVLIKKLATHPSPEIYLQLSENEKLPEKTNFDQKTKYLLDGHKNFPENLEIILKIADETNFLNPQLSIEFYTKAIAINPKNTEIYSDIAHAYMQLESKENQEKAIEFYIKDIISNPDSYGEYSQNYIVDLCKELKDKNAITLLEDSLKTGHNAGTYKVLYKQYFKNKNFNKAAENALKYIEHSDEQAHNYIDISDKFLKKEAYKEAIPILEKTIPRHQWNDRKMRTYNNIGLCYLRIKPQDIDKAYEAFMQAYTLDNKEVAMHQNLYYCGNYFYENKQYKKALKILEFCVTNFNYEKENSLSMIEEMKGGKGFLKKLFK